MAIVEASADTLLRQASMTAHEYMLRAITDIDNHLGEGYAAKHPDLIAAYMKVAAQDFHSATMCQVIERAANIMRGRYDE